MKCTYRLLFLFLVFTAACKSPEPTSLTGDEPVSFKAFVGLFPDLDLPLVMADSSFVHKDRDSSAIRPKLFVQFVPDSVQQKLFGKSKPKIFPVGKVKGDITYLIIKTAGTDRKAAYVLAFDKKDNLIASTSFIQPDNNAATQQNSLFDRKSAIYKNVIRKNPDGTISEGKDVYSFDASIPGFGLVYTDALDDKQPDLVNPIDTFSRKHKFSADYGTGKNNIVSFRDGRKTDRLSFFLHFEKGADCSGELKGEAILKTATMAEYRQAGDPCSIQFIFSANAVTVKEIDGCGAHRGLRCSFNGSFAKKKIAKPKKSKK
ncbi:MAG: hypothetical protein EOO05_05425 [Chitinophagaceae bacterium]|nr:MAG: hypothetical protein EOO05_05425 [Chitinophagaceae bacterium]